MATQIKDSVTSVPRVISPDRMKDFAAGVVGGIGGLLVGHPFDTVKVRLQTQKPGPDGVLRFKGPLHCLVQTVKYEGFQGLFKGLASPLAAGSFNCSISFGTTAFAQHMLKANGREGRLSVGDHMICGAASGIACAPIICPMELVRSLLQIQTGYNQVYSGVSDCVRKLGIRGLWRGLTVTFIRCIPGYSIYFGSYQAFVDILAPGTTQLPTWVQLVAGGLSGMAGWGICYPIDVVKSRLQTQPHSPEGKPLVYQDISHCFRKVYQEEGWRAFFKGLGPTLARAFPVNAAMWFLYQQTMVALNKNFP